MIALEQTEPSRAYVRGRGNGVSMHGNEIILGTSLLREVQHYTILFYLPLLHFGDGVSETSCLAL